MNEGLEVDGKAPGPTGARPPSSPWQSSKSLTHSKILSFENKNAEFTLFPFHSFSNTLVEKHVVHNEDIPPSNVSMEFSCDSHIRFRTHLFLITNAFSQIRHEKIRILDITPLALAALGRT
jgi:hypothetical protein